MRSSQVKYSCQFSKTFINTDNLFYITQTGHLAKINLKDRDKTAAVSQSVKIMFTRMKLNPFEILNIKPIRCGFCNKINNTWFFTHQMSKDRHITLTGIEYKKPGFYCFGNDRECKGKHLNPNSIEFVSVFSNISKDAAKEKIHKRSNSPFYAKNHADKKAYAEFQASNFYGRDLELVRDGINKIANTRRNNEKGYKMRRSGYSFITEQDGHLLRSNGERFFYNYAKEIGISDALSTNGFYPNSILCYDFYFPKLDLFVEISGLTHEKYIKRIEEKQNLFNAFVLKLNRTFENECKDFLNVVKTKLEKKEKCTNLTLD